MARDEYIDGRLMRWGAWLQTGNADGYPRRSTLDPQWRIPPAGMQPASRGGDSQAEARATHQAVLQLSQRLQHTLLVVYVQRKGPVHQAQALGCCQRTIGERVARAHGLLRGLLAMEGVEDE